jgi:hypothetical protein
MKWPYLLCSSRVEASISSNSEGLWSTGGCSKVYPRWFVRYEQVWECVVDVNHDIDDARIGDLRFKVRGKCSKIKLHV